MSNGESGTLAGPREYNTALHTAYGHMALHTAYGHIWPYSYEGSGCLTGRVEHSPAIYGHIAMKDLGVSRGERNIRWA